ncbi:MAG: UDP-N-acetylmuramoyl-tripeptide--D-alanyl-D-alanine ligase [Acidobacteria bacterium]|nr:UDP-N-acetylmuramoyl-tripeptide--D-alanyl-D-alanine ligase [Acidobacteriota bacterium]
MRFTASDVAAATGGELVGPDVEIDGVSVDTRAEVAGRLFVPIVAARDGHDFIPAALAGGAAAYLTVGPAEGGTAIRVDDTLVALGAVGRAARDRLPDVVVGITGSVGKTSVKDLLAAVLAQRFRTVSSERSFNNEIGVPITLANAPGDTEAAVVEMGARGIGHIRLLCGIARPVVGVVTAVGHVHTELFGTIDDVAIGKGELVEALPADGTAILNADDDRVAAMAVRSSAPVVSYGLAGADVTAEHVALDDDLRASFRLCSPAGTVEVSLSARGAHQVSNALAAAAAGLACGVELDAIAAGLHDAALSPWRMELARTRTGALVLNDSYNANPISVAAALQALAHLPARRRVAVLGTMAELGDVADREHAQVGALADRLGLRLVAVGESRYGGELVSTLDDAATLLGDLGEGDAVLLKGSRVAGLERLAERLLG